MTVVELTRYWMEFGPDSNLPAGCGIGVGVTAYNLTDALLLVRERIFKNRAAPPYRKCIEDVDIRDLDQGHVIPNMRSPAERGIWFPMGYAEV